MKTRKRDNTQKYKWIKVEFKKNCSNSSQENKKREREETKTIKSRETSSEMPYLSAAAAAAKSLQLCPTLCDPSDSSPPGSPVPGILQARTLEWVAISFSNARKWKWSRSVSDSSRLHGLQPTRLLCPRDFPGKSTGVGCHHLFHPYMTTGKTIALNIPTFVGKVISLLFNMLSRLLIAFLPRSKHLLISWLQSPFAVILEASPNKVSHCFHCFWIYLPWIDGTGCHNLSFLNVEF